LPSWPTASRSTRAEIEAIRGVDVHGVLESLVERAWSGSPDGATCRAARSCTRRRKNSWKCFGLKDLKSLPTLAELGDELPEHGRSIRLQRRRRARGPAASGAVEQRRTVVATKTKRPGPPRRADQVGEAPHQTESD
jgi:hypothetical protein